MREAMIVWGGWPGHEPETCAHIIADMLKEEDFKVRLETSTDAFNDSSIADLSSSRTDLHSVQDRRKRTRQSH